MSLYTDNPRETQARLTPLSMRQAAHAISEAYAQIFLRDITLDTLCVLLAQTALETGRWRKIWCFNFGNQKASRNYSGYHCYFRCNEVINGEIKWFDPPHPQTRFRAYSTAASGARDYLEFLAIDTDGDGNQYALAWAAAERGDPVEFVNEAKRARYFTAGLEAYRGTVVSLFHEFRAALSQQPLNTLPPAPLEEADERSAFSDDDLVALIRMQYLELSDEDWAEHRRLRDEAVKEP